VKNVYWQMSKDRKTTALKQLQVSSSSSSSGGRRRRRRRRREA